jgi:hypothetical protein
MLKRPLNGSIAATSSAISKRLGDRRARTEVVIDRSTLLIHFNRSPWPGYVNRQQLGDTERSAPTTNITAAEPSSYYHE